jgi:hypothetical protein
MASVIINAHHLTMYDILQFKFDKTGGLFIYCLPLLYFHAGVLLQHIRAIFWTSKVVKICKIYF